MDIEKRIRDIAYVWAATDPEREMLRGVLAALIREAAGGGYAQT